MSQPLASDPKNNYQNEDAPGSDASSVSSNIYHNLQ